MQFCAGAKKFHKVALLIAIESLICVVLFGCSSKVDFPTINTPTVASNIEACRHTNLDFKNPTPVTVRSVITCLNGDNGAFAPYKKLIDESSDETINIFLENYKKYLVRKPERLAKTLSLLEKLKRDGSIGELFRSAAVLIDTKTLENALPLISRYYLKAGSSEELDPLSISQTDFLQKLRLNKQFTPALIALAKIFDSSEMKAVALLLSRDSSAQHSFGSDQVVDLVSDALSRGISNHSVHELTSHLSDQKILNVLKVLDDHSLLEMARILSYHSPSGKDNLERYRRLVIGADRPLTCSKNGNSFQKTNNHLHLGAQEISSKEAGAATADFIMRDLTFLFSSTQEVCDFDPAVIENRDVLTEAVSNGLGDGVRAISKILQNSGRFREFTGVLKSDYIQDFSSLFEEMGKRRALYVLLKAFAQNIDAPTSQIFSDGAVLYTTDERSGESLRSWITEHVSPLSQGALMTMVNQLPAPFQTFLGLKKALEVDPQFDAPLRELINAIATNNFSKSAESVESQLFQKIFSSAAGPRDELKAFVRSFVSSLGEGGAGSGLGAIIGSLAHGASLSDENPVQDFLSDLANDESSSRALAQLLVQAKDNVNFKSALSFTGSLASSGDLEKLLGFTIDILRGSPEVALRDVSAPGSVWAPYLTGDPGNIAKLSPSLVASPVQTDYSSCLAIRGSLFEGSGENFYNGLRCLDSGKNDSFTQIAEHLKKDNLLPQVIEVLKALLVDTSFLSGTLNEASQAVNSGDLQKILKSLAVGSDSSHHLFSKLDPVLAAGLKSSKANDILKEIGAILKSEDLKTGLSGFINASLQKFPKKFKSQNLFRLKVRNSNEVVSKARSWFPELTESELNQLVKDSIDNFETHNEAWKYSEGPYLFMNDTTWQATISNFIRSLLRPQSLEGFVNSLQSISNNFDLPKVLKAAAENQRVALHFSPNGQKHFHIQSQLDQIETLLENSHFGVPLVRDAGVHFLLSVAHSGDLPQDMRSQYSLLQLGYNASKVLSPLDVQMHFVNMINNYSVINEFADNGTLKIFQKLIQGAYNSTPDPYKDSEDPGANHIGALRALTDFGIFENMTLGVSSLEAQGALPAIINDLMGTLAKLRPEDVQYLRSILQDAPVEYFIDQLIAVSKNGEGYQNLKESLLQFASSYSKFGLDPGIFLKSLAGLMHQRPAWDTFSRHLLSDLQNPDGNILKIGLSVDHLSQESLLSLQTVVRENAEFLPTLTTFIAEVYAKNPAIVGELFDALVSWSEDPRVAGQGLSLAVQRILELSKGKSGLGDMLARVLNDDKLRAELITILSRLALSGDLSKVFDHLSNLVNSGDLDETLHFVFDNTSLLSLRLH